MGDLTGNECCDRMLWEECWATKEQPWMNHFVNTDVKVLQEHIQAKVSDHVDLL